MKVKLIIVLSLTVMFSGCTINKEKLTSGLIGCPEENIEVTESSGGFMANTWTAKCNEKTFYCTERSGSRVDCKQSILED